MKANETYCEPDNIFPDHDTWPIPAPGQAFPTDPPYSALTPEPASTREGHFSEGRVPRISDPVEPKTQTIHDLDSTIPIPSRDVASSGENEPRQNHIHPSTPTSTGHRASEGGSAPADPASAPVPPEIANTRAKALLSQLDPSQIQRLYLWLYQFSAARVARLIARPAPEGFGIKTHVTTLKRIRARLRADDTVDLLEAGADHIDLVMREVAPACYQPLIIQLLERQALYMAQQNAAAPALQPLLMAIARFSELHHKQEHLAYLRDRHAEK